MLTRKRVILSAAQKNENFVKKRKKSNVELAQEYKVEKTTITDILKKKNVSALLVRVFLLHGIMRRNK